MLARPVSNGRYSVFHQHLLLPPVCHEDNDTLTGSLLFSVLKRKSSALTPIITARNRARSKLLGCQVRRPKRGQRMKGDQINLRILGEKS